ncbi:MAG TPA: carboxypeptidase regulatory-like domain-containing protein, partial [Thermoplasmatales archaeon]|nr:carboxypeptidase regulatory-like domain-containing protein [Thermoplasmatales archaeon]
YVPCEPNISVDKKAWDGNTWVDELHVDEFGVKIRFNITIKNTGTVELKNITVADTPSDCCLRDPTDFKPNYTEIQDNNIYWRLNTSLKSNEKLYIEFSAFVYCNVTNTVQVYANSSYGNVNDSDELPINREISKLSYSPTSYDFGIMTPGETANTTFEIWNSGNGTLRYTITEDCQWVEVSPTTGESTGERDNITIYINTTNLPINTTHVCNLTISSNGGTGVFTVQVKVVSGPHLSYTPTSHEFGQMYEGAGSYTTFEIWNSGSGTLSYSLSEDCSWVDIAPLSGTSTGEHDVVTVALNTTGLTPGNHTCNITITSNGGNGVFTVHVTVESRPTPPNITLLRPKENTLYINNKEITTFFTTRIIGPITIHANATDSDGYIEKVEFYIDNTLEFNDTLRPYSWVWNEKAIGRHTITVKAYDNDGFTSQKSLTVKILNLGFGSVNKYGVLQGKVTEEGRILDIGLPNVNVTVSNGNHTTTGNTPFVDRGIYSLTLPEGVYDVTFEAKDYHTYVAKNVEVVRGAATTLNVQLEYICEGCD